MEKGERRRDCEESRKDSPIDRGKYEEPSAVRSLGRVAIATTDVWS